LIGFVSDTNRFAILRKGKDSITSSIDVYDAETGERILSTIGPRSEDYILPLRMGLPQGVVFSTGHPGVEGNDWTYGLHILDLRTGQWRRLSNRRISSGLCHPKKTWIVAIDSNNRAALDTWRVVAIDWQTGKELFVRLAARRESFFSQPFFIADTDQIAVPISSTGLFSQTPRQQLEIWTLGNPPVCERTIDDAPALWFPSYSMDGRVAFAEQTDGGPFDVYDAKEGRFLLSVPLRDERQPGPRVPSRLHMTTLSSNGRRVLGGSSATVWDVDTGRIVWQATPADYPVAGENSNDTIYVRESWQEYWKAWLPRIKYDTSAIRDFDGRLIVRMPANARIQPFYWNAERSLSVAGDGNVYRLPLPVNWALLALCQIVLAMPLVGLWAVMRWRRARRSRKAVAT